MDGRSLSSDAQGDQTGARRQAVGEFALLKRYLLPFWRHALALALVMVASIALQLVNPQIIRGFIDAALEQADPTRLLRSALFFLAVGLLAKGARLATTYLSTDLGFRTTNALRSDLARHALSLDMPFHKATSPGEMIERIDGDVTALASFFTQFAVRVLGNGVLVIGIILLLFREDWRIGIIMAAFVVGAMAIMLRRGDVAVGESAAERQVNADLYGFVEERLSGLDDIRANASESYTLWRFDRLLRNLYQVATSAWDKRLSVIRFASAVWGLGQVLALGLGVFFYTRNALTIGGVYLLLHYTTMFLEPMEQIADQIQDMQKASASVQRIGKLLAERSRIRGAGVRSLPDGPLPVSFDRVTFAYDDGEPVLQEISLQLEPDATLGLLGRSGSGKTTLTRLLFRLYDPSEGTIRLGDTSLTVVEPDYVRQRIGMVTQDVQLFRATVRDNVAFFRRDVSDSDIIRAVENAGLGPWLAALPDGLDTEIAPDGGDLSAGQAQLLAFARVFLGDPSIVVLDEPSARLDPATERELDRAVTQLLQGRTGIIIAHRLDTVERVDQIAILEGGRLIEHGQRSALAGDPASHFARLLDSQLEETLA